MATKAGATRSSRAAARLLAASARLPGLAADDFAALADDISTVPLLPGHQLFAHGDRPDALYVVVNGDLEVVIPSADGEQHLSYLSAGAVVGEIGLLAGD